MVALGAGCNQAAGSGAAAGSRQNKVLPTRCRASAWVTSRSPVLAWFGAKYAAGSATSQYAPGGDCRSPAAPFSRNTGASLPSAIIHKAKHN